MHTLARFAVIACLLPWGLQAQQNEPMTALDPYNIGQDRHVAWMPFVQTWRVEDAEDLTEFGSRLRVRHRISRKANVALQTSQGWVRGLGADLQGFTDTQLALSYRVFAPDVALNFAVNLPTGQLDLTPEAFATSTAVANNIFGFEIPNYGQGLNLTVGAVWATALTDNLVAGLGASYQVRSEYKPVENILYDPSDELLLTGGFDYRFSETLAFDADVIVVLHGKDQLDNQAFLDVGNRYTLHLKLTRYLDHHELAFWSYMRYQAQNQAEAAFVFVDVAQRNPNGVELHGLFRLRANPRLNIHLQAMARFYGETTLNYGEARLGGLILRPEYRLRPGFVIPVQVTLQSGSLFYRPGAGRRGVSGIAAQIGFRAAF